MVFYINMLKLVKFKVMNYLKVNYLTIILIVITFIEIIFGINIAKFEINISDNLIIYGILNLFNIIIDFVNNYLQSLNSKEIKLDFEKKQFNKYQKLDQKSKEIDTIDSFTNKISAASRAIDVECTWGLSILNIIIKTICSFGYIIYTRNHTYTFIIFTILNIFWYYVITKKHVDNLTVERDKTRKERHRNYDLLNLYGKRFHNDYCDEEKIINIKNILFNMEMKISFLWNKLSSLQKIPNYIMYILIPFLTNPNEYFTLYIIIINLNSVISQVLSFANQYNTFQNDKKTEQEFWIDKTFTKKLDQFNIPSKIIANGFINNLITVSNLEIEIGDRIRINGPSGCGKTTLIKGLIGHYNEIKYKDIDERNYFPLNFSDKIAYMRQDIRETLPVAKTTIRELFYDECDDSLILTCLKIVNLQDWFDKIKTYDTVLESIISGGEKTRLCLAITLYHMIKKNSQLLILDEPEQGIDPELAPKMLQNIFDKFPFISIIIITHLCQCQLENLKINKVWSIEENKVINK